MRTPTVTLNGTQYVMVERDEYERLKAMAKAADLPELPKPDAEGNVPALEYCRASIARDLIRERLAARLSQRQLAKLAGVRFETICRIETGKNTPSIATIEKIERALKRAPRRHNGR